MHSLRLGSAYFLAIFAIGLVIRRVRTLEVFPEIGERAADLIEAPIMLAVILMASAWVVRGTWPADAKWRCAGIGLTCLVLVLVAGWLIDFGPIGIRPKEFWNAKDYTTPCLFFGGLFFLTAAPSLVRQIMTRESESTDPI